METMIKYGVSLVAVSLLLACSDSSSVAPSQGTAQIPTAGLSSSSTVVVPLPQSSSTILVASSSSEIVIPPVESSSSEITNSAGMVLWQSDDGSAVSTGGYWFAYDDQSDGGASKWTCAGVDGAKGDPVDNCFDEEGDLNIQFTVSAAVANDPYDPYGFAGVGFNLMDEVAGEKVPFVEMANYQGIVLKYSATKAFYIQVVYDEIGLGYDVHRKKLLAGENVEIALKWSDLKQANFGVKGDLSANLAEVKEIKFQAHSENFEGEASFQLHSISLQ